MKLIWYNSMTKQYEYGSTKEFRSLKNENSSIFNTVTILMEFSQNNDALAQKIIRELNMVKKEMMAI